MQNLSPQKFSTEPIFHSQKQSCERDLCEAFLLRRRDNGKVLGCVGSRGLCYVGVSWGVSQLGGIFLLFGEHDYFHVVACLEDYVLHEGCNLGWGEALDDALVVGFGVDTAAYVHVVNA